MISTNPFKPDRVQLPANKERTQGPLTVLLCITRFPARFRRHVQIIEPNNGCWLWTAGRSGPPGFPEHAYGRYWATLKPRRCQIAHRFAYEFARGPIPEGFEVDHLCDNKLCVNPAHLELVTHQQNCKRRKRSRPLPKKAVVA